MKKDREPGTVPEGRFPIYDHKDRLRGHVGPHATEVTVARFTGQHGSTMEKRDGRDVWVSPPPPKPPKPKFPNPAAGAPQPGADGKPGAGGKPVGGDQGKHTLEISLKTAKGSAAPKKAATAKP